MYDFSDSYKEFIKDIQNEITLLSNSSAFFNMWMEDISWVGFYLYQKEKLILGPFQGQVACTIIAMGKGVCGTSAQNKEVLIVEDVHTFDGHIACDCASNSEIVLPILIENTLYGVLDIDSTSFARFHKEDQVILEKCVKLLSDKIKMLRKS